MTIDTNTVQHLQAALTAALSASRAFEPLLAAELEALKSADPEALNNVVERKKALTETLLGASERLLGWCERQEIEPDYAAFANWSQALPESEGAPLRQSWLDLRQSLEANNRSSAVNRQVLSSLTARNQAQLTLFKNLLGTPDTYTAAGTKTSGSGGGWVDRV